MSKKRGPREAGANEPTGGLPVETREEKSPAANAQPQTVRYVRRQWQPCKHCARVKTDHGSRAVVVLATWREYAYLQCRCCGIRYRVEVVDG